jgi:nucleoside-diphosphate-sugar epimerase
VLVIGGGGFIGSHTLPALVAHGHPVHATHSPGRAPTAVPGVTWVSCDLGRGCGADWPADCETVIYLAQSRRWRSFPDGADDVFQVNVASVVRAVEHARRTGARRFIFASTGSVCSQTTRPAREADPVDVGAPRSFYVASKLAAEVLLRAYQEHLAVVNLRLFVPYGPGQNADMLIPRLVRSVREGQPVHLHGEDGLRCNPVAATEVAEAVCRCLELDRTVTLNVGGPEALTLRQIATHIGHAVGREPRFEVRPNEPAPVLVGDTAALRSALAWAPAVAFEQGLRDWPGAAPVALAG